MQLLISGEKSGKILWTYLIFGGPVLVDMTQITDQIHLGGWPTKWPDDIDAIIALYHHQQPRYAIPSHAKGFVSIQLSDEGDERPDNTWFDAQTGILRKYVEKDCRVLVHCAAGVSRSPTLVIAYLMRYNGLTMEQAMDYVGQRRDIIYPNPTFRLALKEYEEHLKAK